MLTFIHNWSPGAIRGEGIHRGTLYADSVELARQEADRRYNPLGSTPLVVRECEGYYDVKNCELCPKKALPGERYCPTHRATVLKEMSAEGYLTDVPSLPWEKDDSDRRHPVPVDSQRDGGSVEDLVNAYERSQER